MFAVSKIRDTKVRASPPDPATAIRIMVAGVFGCALQVWALGVASLCSYPFHHLQGTLSMTFVRKADGFAAVKRANWLQDS